MKKTTIELPEDVWKAVKIRAIKERRTLASVVIAALREWLKDDR